MKPGDNDKADIGVVDYVSTCGVTGVKPFLY
jgi:hypothetical protein